MSIAVVLLTYNEEVHIRRCIESLLPVTSVIKVIDSYSNDDTVPIAQSLGAVVLQRKWTNHADQFQWGLDNSNIVTDWVMRVDADEYLEPELQSELQKLMSEEIPNDVTGFYIRRKVLFQDKWIRHGGFYPHKLMRLWRNGQGRVEQRLMDEHIVLPAGSKTGVLKGHLVDDNLKGITFWIDKHNSYASREMVELLVHKYHLAERDQSLKEMKDPQAKWKRILKESVYAKLPPGIRSTIYFIYRYIFRLGFLDGSKGFIWHFMQGYWYRMLVDVKLMEVEERSGGDPEKIRKLLNDEYGIKL